VLFLLYGHEMCPLTLMEECKFEVWKQSTQDNTKIYEV